MLAAAGRRHSLIEELFQLRVFCLRLFRHRRASYADDQLRLPRGADADANRGRGRCELVLLGGQLVAAARETELYELALSVALRFELSARAAFHLDRYLGA